MEWAWTAKIDPVLSLNLETLLDGEVDSCEDVYAVEKNTRCKGCIHKGARRRRGREEREVIAKIKLCGEGAIQWPWSSRRKRPSGLRDQLITPP